MPDPRLPSFLFAFPALAPAKFSLSEYFMLFKLSRSPMWCTLFNPLIPPILFIIVNIFEMLKLLMLLMLFAILRRLLMLKFLGPFSPALLTVLGYFVLAFAVVGLLLQYWLFDMALGVAPVEPGLDSSGSHCRWLRRFAIVVTNHALVAAAASHLVDADLGCSYSVIAVKTNIGFPTTYIVVVNVPNDPLKPLDSAVVVKRSDPSNDSWSITKLSILLLLLIWPGR